MYQSETMDAVRDAAQTLTREGKVLTIGNPEFPLAVFADTYKVDAEPTNTALPEEEIVAIEEHFDEINQDSTPAEDDTRESIVSNLHTAIAKVQFNTTNVIIPSIREMHQFYAGLQTNSSQPEYAVTPWRYLAPHNNPALVNHVNTRYSTYRPPEQFTSYDLEAVSAEAIIEMISVNNPHLEQEEATEWALKVGSERLLAVWNSLFNVGGHVVPAGLQYLSAQAAPFNVDDILVAYFLAGHYMENPVTVPNVSVGLEEWEHTMRLLHEMFGFYLMRAYIRRAEHREEGHIILRNEALNAINTRRAVVIVNGDVFDPWVVGGGDIQAILGAAVENTGVTDVRHLDANAAKFIARWHELYPLIKQSAIDYADRQRMNNVVTTFREVSKSELLRDRYNGETEARLIEALRYIRRDDYENPYKVFSSLICRVYFPESTYIEYLDAIDSYGQDFPKATVRELATQAIITLVAIFQAKQVNVEPFIPEIDPNATAGGPVDDSGLLAVVDEEAESEDPVVDDIVESDNAEIGDDATVADDITDAVDDGSVEESTVEETDLDFEGDDEEDAYADLETVESNDEELGEVEETIDEEPVVEETETEEVEETSDSVEETDTTEETVVEETSESDDSTEEVEEETEEEEEDETPLA